MPVTQTLRVACIFAALLMTSATTSPTLAAAKKASPKPSTTKRPAVLPGGANQVEGLTGKIGDMLFTGRWRFQVLDIHPVSTSYTLIVPSSEQDYAKFHDVASADLGSHTFTPKEGYTFFAVKCRAKNAQKTTEQLDFYLGDPKTAITDAGENSYPPIVYDMQSNGNWVTKKLLPGSGVDMTLVFAVPPGTVPKDLVVSLKNWSDNNSRNVRVSLSK